MLLNLVKKHWMLLTVSLTLLITFLSFKPSGITTPAVGFDKIYHCLAYATLILPVAISRPHQRHWFALGFVLYSGSIELIQPMVGRQGEWLDFLMNAIGLGIGVWLGKSILLNKKLKNSH